MLNQDDRYEEETGGIGRGMVFGATLGLLLWTVIIGCVYFLFF